MHAKSPIVENVSDHFEARLIGDESLREWLHSNDKYLLFLISVGQPYHEGNQLSATVDVFIEILQRLQQMATSQILEPNTLCTNLEVLVVIADTLQAYNEEEFLKNPKPCIEKWKHKGEEWRQKHGEPQFQKLAAVSNTLIKVNIRYKHWYEFENDLKCYHFQRYFSLLSFVYNKEQVSNFFGAVNIKGNNYLYRKKRGTQLKAEAHEKETERLTEEWRVQKLDGPNLRYILEEYAILEGCIREGMGFEAIDNKMLQRNKTLLLVYPHKEEEAFQISRSIIDDSYKQGQKFQFVIRWLRVELSPVSKIITRNDNDFLNGFSNGIKKNDRRYESKQLWLMRSLICGWNGNSLYCKNSACKGTFIFNYPKFDQHLSIPRKRLTENLLQKLDKSSFANSNSFIVNIYGMGGIGKTHFVKYYYYNNNNHYNIQIWIDCGTYPGILNVYKKLITKFGLNINSDDSEGYNQKVICVMKKWFETNAGWLLVIDDINDPQLDRYMPQSGGHLIKISRTRPENYQELNAAKTINIPIPVMDANESCALLKASSRRTDNFEKLCDLLGNLPLALEMAGNYLCDNQQQAISDFIISYELNLSQLADDSKYSNDASKTVYAVFQTSVQKIRQQYKLRLDKESCPMVERKEKLDSYVKLICEILTIFSYLSPNEIPLSIIEEYYKKMIDNEMLAEVVDVLARHSIIEYSRSPDKISIHPVLQDILRSDRTLVDENSHNMILKKLAATMYFVVSAATSLKTIADSENIEEYENLFAHMLFLEKYYKKIPDYRKHYLQFFIILGVVYANFGDPAKCQELLEDIFPTLKEDDENKYKSSVLNTLKDCFGDESREFPEALEKLALAYGILKNSDKRKTLMKEAIPLLKKFYGDQSLQFANSLNSLGYIYMKLELYYVAIALYLKSEQYHPGKADFYRSKYSHIVLWFRDKKEEKEHQEEKCLIGMNILNNDDVIICKKQLEKFFDRSAPALLSIDKQPGSISQASKHMLFSPSKPPAGASGSIVTPNNDKSANNSPL
jgi:hypothetical protein